MEERLDHISDESPARTEILPRSGLNALIQSLENADYRVIGPTIRNGAITFGDISSDAGLPVGWTDAQVGGEYRLKKRRDKLVFGYVVGPHSLKQFLFAPRRQLVAAKRMEDGRLRFTESVDEPERIAVIGARPCDVAGMLVQDRTFMSGPFPDPDYVRRRGNLFVVAVNCSHPASTCFCTSMNTGPRARSGFDLALTELHGKNRHDFLVEVGSDAGASILDRLDTKRADEADLAMAEEVTKTAAGAITKQLDTDGIRDLLLSNLDHPEWDAVAARCLSCANCTMACPTCFCSKVDEVTDLTGTHAERWQTWDSCFAVDHSYLHGGPVRKSGKARYRQWMTHKLASWIDQFGTSGCVGCGRCITWCPVGIDITEEVARIRATPNAKKEPAG